MKIKVIEIRAGKQPREKMIGQTKRTFQRHVGGQINVLTVCSDLFVVCNANGRSHGLPYNCTIAGIPLYGTVVICGKEGDEFTEAPLSLDMLNTFGLISRGAEA